MPKEISALELRNRFGEIMEEVRYRKEPYIVKRNGRPMIVLLDIESFEKIQAELEDEPYIEEYTKERLEEFLKEDKVDPKLLKQARKLLLDE